MRLARPPVAHGRRPYPCWTLQFVPRKLLNTIGSPMSIPVSANRDQMG